MRSFIPGIAVAIQRITLGNKFMTHIQTIDSPTMQQRIMHDHSTIRAHTLIIRAPMEGLCR